MTSKPPRPTQAAGDPAPLTFFKTPREKAAADKAANVKTLMELGAYETQLHSSCDYVLKNFDLRQEARSEEMDALNSAKARAFVVNPRFPGISKVPQFFVNIFYIFSSSPTFQQCHRFSKYHKIFHNVLVIVPDLFFEM